MFLPEEDQDFLGSKRLPYALREETVDGQKRQGVEFNEFPVPPNLGRRIDGKVETGGNFRLLVVIPVGYPKAKLDSWYAIPRLVHLDGSEVDRANGEQTLFGETWQFWSRHLEEGDWNPDQNGLDTYLQYIRSGLRKA
jgi:hypothetical protein